VIVFATVGTDQHPFDRLVRWLDRIAAGSPDLQCVIQYGTSTSPAFASGIDYLNHNQLMSWIDRADVVITHGGPASIVQVREQHGRPIVVPRDPRRGEHVDRHQLEFAAMLARMNAISLASSAEDLDRLVQVHLAEPPIPLSTLSGAPIGVAGFAREVNTMLGARTPVRRRR
jgi:UDP-N-acetylglucosamine transferase subunit ALG13